MSIEVSMHFFKLLDFVRFSGFGGFESELLVLIRALQVGPNSFLWAPNFSKQDVSQMYNQDSR